MPTRTYRDAIHQDVTLDLSDPVEALLDDLINTPEFQRLRRIKQVGVAWLVFPCAEHTRFQHSIGTMHVARKIYNHLETVTSARLWNREDGPADHRAALLCAALLHDIGHGPFSHSCEKITGINHESWTYKIIMEDTNINKILEEYDEELPHIVTDILTGCSDLDFLTDIVSSNLDADRMDYLLRDSYFSGAYLGTYDLNLLIRSLRIDFDQNRLVVVGDKGLCEVERFLHSGYHCYQRIFYHKTVLAADYLFQRILYEIKDSVNFNKLLKKWLNNEADTHEYLKLDDHDIFDFIKQSNDYECYRFLTRNLPKIEETEFIDKANVTLPKQPSRFYTPTEGNEILYRDNMTEACETVEISTASKLIQSLRQDGEVINYLVTL